MDEILRTRASVRDPRSPEPVPADATVTFDHVSFRYPGAEDDVLWDTAKYIRRMEKRLAEKPHECEAEAVVYAHGTHFVFPEGMLKTMLPVGSALFVKLAFQAAKNYPKECRQTRIDIEKRMSRTLTEWKGEK